MPADRPRPESDPGRPGHDEHRSHDDHPRHDKHDGHDKHEGHSVAMFRDARDVPRILRLSAATYRKMVQNLWWAAGYNVVAIPLAAGVLFSWGILLHPAVGAILMSLSTVIVALNAQLLRRVSL